MAGNLIPQACRIRRSAALRDRSERAVGGKGFGTGRGRAVGGVRNRPQEGASEAVPGVRRGIRKEGRHMRHFPRFRVAGRAAGVVGTCGRRERLRDRSGRVPAESLAAGCVPAAGATCAACGGQTVMISISLVVEGCVEQLGVLFEHLLDAGFRRPLASSSGMPSFWAFS